MSTKDFHGRLSLRYRGKQRCMICKRLRIKTKFDGQGYICEECARKQKVK